MYSIYLQDINLLEKIYQYFNSIFSRGSFAGNFHCFFYIYICICCISPVFYNNIFMHSFYDWKKLKKHHVQINFPAHFSCINLWSMCYLLWSQQQRINGTADKAGKITLMCLIVIKMWPVILYDYGHLVWPFYLLTLQI